MRPPWALPTLTARRTLHQSSRPRTSYLLSPPNNEPFHRPRLDEIARRSTKPEPLEGLVPSISSLKTQRRIDSMEQSQLIAHSGTRKLSREELKAVTTPEGTFTH